jgi:hypothetical protein
MTSSTKATVGTIITMTVVHKFVALAPCKNHIIKLFSLEDSEG